jgi:hypothetical protein
MAKIEFKNSRTPKILALIGISFVFLGALINFFPSMLTGSFAYGSKNEPSFGLAIFISIAGASLFFSSIFLEDKIRYSSGQKKALKDGEEVVIYELPHCFLVYGENLKTLGQVVPTSDRDVYRERFKELGLEPTKPIVEIKTVNGIKKDIERYMGEIRKCEEYKEYLLRENPRGPDFEKYELEQLRKEIKEKEEIIAYSEKEIEDYPTVKMATLLHEFGHVDSMYKWKLPSTHEALKAGGHQESMRISKWSEANGFIYEVRGLLRYVKRDRAPLEKVRFMIRDTMKIWIDQPGSLPNADYRGAIMKVFGLEDLPGIDLKTVLNYSKFARYLYDLSIDDLDGLLIQLDKRHKEMYEEFKKEEPIRREDSF